MSGILTLRWPQAGATRHLIFVIVASLSVAGCGWGGPLVPTAGGVGECPDGLCGAPNFDGESSLVAPERLP